MTNKAKQRARALMKDTGMSYQAALQSQGKRKEPPSGGGGGHVWDHEPTELCFDGICLHLTVSVFDGTETRHRRALEAVGKYGAERRLLRRLGEVEEPTSDPVKAAFRDAWWEVQRANPYSRLAQRPPAKLDVAEADHGVYSRTMGEIAHTIHDAARMANETALSSLPEVAQAMLRDMLSKSNVKMAGVFTSRGGQKIWPPIATGRGGPDPIASEAYCDDPAFSDVVVCGFAEYVRPESQSRVEGRFPHASAAWKAA